jgi:hypothetical protein
MTGLLSPAWAATLPGPIGLTTGANFSLEGLNLKIVSCTVTGSGSCGNAELVAISASRGAISFLLVGDGGIVGGTQSAALTGTKNTNTSLSLVLAVSQAGSSKVVNDVSASTVGTYDLGSCSGSCSTAPVATGAATVNVATGGTPLLDTLTQNTSQQTQASGPMTLNTPTGSFNLTETLTLNVGNFNISSFNIFSQLITFHPAPEPATLSIMLLGLGGLAIARRRRRAGSRSLA